MRKAFWYCAETEFSWMLAERWKERGRTNHYRHSNECVFVHFGVLGVDLRSRSALRSPPAGSRCCRRWERWGRIWMRPTSAKCRGMTARAWMRDLWRPSSMRYWMPIATGKWWCIDTRSCSSEWTSTTSARTRTAPAPRRRILSDELVLLRRRSHRIRREVYAVMFSSGNQARISDKVRVRLWDAPRILLAQDVKAISVCNRPTQRLAEARQWKNQPVTLYFSDTNPPTRDLTWLRLCDKAVVWICFRHCFIRPCL